MNKDERKKKRCFSFHTDNRVIQNVKQMKSCQKIIRYYA